MDIALQEAIRRVGGMRAMGRALGIAHQAISQWPSAPAQRVLEIERLSGISRHDLRPDLYPRAALDSPQPPPPDQKLRLTLATDVHVTCVSSFAPDDRTLALIAELRGTFGVNTSAGVIRKALALADLASRYADADNTITILSGVGKLPVTVSLAG